MMFGKKNKEGKTPHPEYLELVKRWETYLGKMEARFNELLGQAEEAVMDHLTESDFNLHPTQQAWQSMKRQLQNLTDKIEVMFEEKVEPAMVAYVESHEHMDEEKKGADLREGLFKKLERFERELEGRIAFKFYDHAIAYQNENFNCSQCGGKLEIKKDVFRTHYVACNFCNTTNTFTPSSKVQDIQWVVIDNIAKYNCLTQWDEIHKAEDHYHSLIENYETREDKAAQTVAIQKIEDTTKAYWEKYLKERIVMMSEYQETYEKDLKAKMTDFYQWKEHQSD